MTKEQIKIMRNNKRTKEEMHNNFILVHFYIGVAFSFSTSLVTLLLNQRFYTTKNTALEPYKSKTLY